MDVATKLQQARHTFLRLLEQRGIQDAAVLRAMAQVPREAFVASALAERAYDDGPLPIEKGQTISQPYMVALMTQALQLRPEHTVLEIGTGSGYSAAVLAGIVKQVYTVERHARLAYNAERRLLALGYHNVAVLQGDGTLGWPEFAPFDVIVVTAGGPGVPQSLVNQLVPGGHLLIPAGASQHSQTLLRVTRTGVHTSVTEDLGAVRFVPLIGKEGWS